MIFSLIIKVTYAKNVDGPNRKLSVPHETPLRGGSSCYYRGVINYLEDDSGTCINFSLTLIFFFYVIENVSGNTVFQCCVINSPPYGYTIIYQFPFYWAFRWFPTFSIISLSLNTNLCLLRGCPLRVRFSEVQFTKFRTVDI